MSALTTLAPIAVRLASTTSLSRSEYFGLALLGADVLSSRLFKIAEFIEKHMRQSDDETAQEMVSRMRADVPQDTGRLFNGIGYETDGDVMVVFASAVNPEKSGGEDYAGFVEFGTQPGERGKSVSYTAVADADYHDATSGLGPPTIRTYPRRRLQYRTHAGTPAQPYFFDNAFDVLRERRANLDDVITSGAIDAGDFQ